MKNCSKCGTELADDVRFCTGCGQPLEEILEEAKTMEATGAATAPSMTPVAPATQSKGPGIASIILGGLSLCMCYFGIIGGFLGIIPLACAIVGLILGGKCKKQGSKLGRIGFILSLIGLIVSGVLMIIGIIIVGTAAAAGVNYNF